MKYKKLDNGKKISKVGFGGWGLSGDSYGKINTKRSIKLLNFAYQNGINFIDTSINYNSGESERRIGKFLNQNNIDRNKIIISTKGGLYTTKKNEIEKHNFSNKFIKSQIKQSLKNLNTNFIDIYFLHSVSKKNLKNKKIFNFLKEYKKEKIINYIGVSPDHPSDALYFAKTYKIDFIQINLNLFDQRIIDIKLLEVCKKKNIQIIVRTPLSFGFLGVIKNIKNIKKNKLDHRSYWDKSQLLHWQKSLSLFEHLKGKHSFPVFSLKFCLYFKNVISVIPGMLKDHEILENIKCTENSQLSKKIIKKIYDIYKNNKFIIKKRERLY